MNAASDKQCCCDSVTKIVTTFIQANPQSVSTTDALGKLIATVREQLGGAEPQKGSADKAEAVINVLAAASAPKPGYDPLPKSGTLSRLVIDILRNAEGRPLCANAILNEVNEHTGVGNEASVRATIHKLYKSDGWQEGYVERVKRATFRWVTRQG